VVKTPLRGEQSCGVFLPDLTTAKALPPCGGVPMGCDGRQGVDKGFRRYGLAAREEMEA